jgi:hypothetical protein
MPYWFYAAVEIIFYWLAMVNLLIICGLGFINNPSQMLVCLLAFLPMFIAIVLLIRMVKTWNIWAKHWRKPALLLLVVFNVYCIVSGQSWVTDWPMMRTILLLSAMLQVITFLILNRLVKWLPEGWRTQIQLI